ncbi:MAG: hypothetical protein A3E87_03680 [Gammaproteobacteria bacterium RIFCSPHIGHO2_12_FULL_35_23]|nr:MAG: hypothetical protein A3E87_03680 [Gammaproteobacteria bacterium RIFCSPHIGHO2_12_FULL_35_23]
MKRHLLTASALEKVLSNTKTLRVNKEGKIKVSLSMDGQSIIKCFYFYHKGFYRRYCKTIAGEFIANASQLLARDILTVFPSAWYRCLESHCDVIIYPILQGQTVKEIIDETNDFTVLSTLANYIAKLHHKNIYFRAGHLDNYLLRSDNNFAIIDIDNLRFSLSLRKIAKNLVFIYRHSLENEQKYFLIYGFNRFLDNYFDASNLPTYKKNIIKYWIKYYLRRMKSYLARMSITV